MLPTLGGRIQTRIFLLATVGVIITAILTPFLPGLTGTMGQRYGVTYLILLTVLILGIIWEFIYHFLMQFRWEKDWPTMFGFLTFINEGIVVYLLVKFGLVPGVNPAPPALAFWILFFVVWFFVWAVANGPMRIPFIRWRFHGGRLI